MAASREAGTLDDRRRRSRLTSLKEKSMRRYICCWSVLTVCVCALALLLAHPARAAASAAPFTVEDLVMLKRISDPQVSPDGRYLAFVQRETEMGANRGRTTLWLMALAAGARPQQLTDPSGGDSSPRWAPDSRTLYFLSTRSGSQQVWRVVLTGAVAQRVTDFPLEVGSLRVSPLGKLLAVSMEVFPDCTTLTCTRERLDARAKAKADGQIYDRLFVRHWDRWSDGTRSHLFTMPVDAPTLTTSAVDVMRGFDADVPSKPFGADEDLAFSPDGRTLVFSARIAGHTESWSTAAQRPSTSRRATRPGTRSRYFSPTATSRGSHRSARASSPIAFTLCCAAPAAPASVPSRAAGTARYNTWVRRPTAARCLASWMSSASACCIASIPAAACPRG